MATSTRAPAPALGLDDIHDIEARRTARKRPGIRIKINDAISLHLGHAGTLPYW